MQFSWFFFKNRKSGCFREIGSPRHFYFGKSSKFMISVLWKRRRSIVYFLHSARTARILPRFIRTPLRLHTFSSHLVKLIRTFFQPVAFFFHITKGLILRRQVRESVCHLGERPHIYIYISQRVLHIGLDEPRTLNSRFSKSGCGCPRPIPWDCRIACSRAPPASGVDRPCKTLTDAQKGDPLLGRWKERWQCWDLLCGS